MNSDTTKMGRTTASTSAVLLLVVSSAVFAVGALSAADTLVGSEPGERPLSRDAAVLAVRVQQATTDDGAAPRENTGAHENHAQVERHPHGHEGRPLPARVEITRGDRAATFATSERGMVHLDLPAGRYGVSVTTRIGTDSIHVETRGLTHVLVNVHDDGAMNFTVEHHRPHHPPWHGGPRHVHEAHHAGSVHHTDEESRAERHT